MAFRDQRTPLWIKVVMVATVLYLISPIDVVPDWLLILGLTDDLIVVTVVAWLLGKFIPQSVKDKANLPKPSQ